MRAKCYGTAVGDPDNFFSRPSQLHFCVPQIADLSFCLTNVLLVTFGALDHVDDISGRAADAMTYLSFFTCRGKGVKRGSFFNKRTCFTPIYVTTENFRCLIRWSAVYSSDENVT